MNKDNIITEKASKFDKHYFDQVVCDLKSKLKLHSVILQIPCDLIF